MNEIKLKRNNNGNYSTWMTDRPHMWGDSILCGQAVVNHVDIPKSVLNITMVWHTKRVSNSFKVRPNTSGISTAMNPFVVCGTKGTPLHHQMDIIIRKQLKLGNQYFTLEYE